MSKGGEGYLISSYKWFHPFNLDGSYYLFIGYDKDGVGMFSKHHHFLEEPVLGTKNHTSLNPVP